MRRIHKYSLIALLLVFAYSCGKKETTHVPIGKVQKGTFYIDMYEEGEIEAVNSINIASPTISWRYGNLKVTQIVKDGSEVKAGDTLVVFDPSEVNKGIVEAEGALEISRAEMEKLQAQHQSDLEELRADYEVTRISQEISKINFESAVYESEIKRKEIQLNLEKADIALAKAKEQIENRIKIQKEEIKQRELTTQQSQSRLDEAYGTLEKLFVTTPSPGIAIISKNWTNGNKFQVGDQCYTGFPVIQLPDLSALKATVKINEVDIAKIGKGLSVEIKPDAFSDSIFSGEVNAVANLAVSKDNTSKIKVFPVEILIKETNPNLLPGLTVSCRILIEKLEDVLYIPLEGVHLEGDKYYVYKKTRGGFSKTEVEVGATNTDHIVIVSGLDKEDEIALVNPYEEEKKSEETKTDEV